VTTTQPDKYIAVARNLIDEVKKGWVYGRRIKK
jgi:hypothetical protein